MKKLQIGLLGALIFLVLNPPLAKADSKFSFTCSPDIQSSPDCAAFVKTEILKDQGCKFSPPSLDCGGSPGKGLANRRACSYRIVNTEDLSKSKEKKIFVCEKDIKTDTACRAKMQSLFGFSKKGPYAMASYESLEIDTCHVGVEQVEATIYSCSISSLNCSVASVNGGDLYPIDPTDTNYYDKRYSCPVGADKMIVSEDRSVIDYTKKEPIGLPSPGNEAAVFCKTLPNTTPQPAPQNGAPVKSGI